MDQKERQPMGPGPKEVSDNIISLCPESTKLVLWLVGKLVEQVSVNTFQLYSFQIAQPMKTSRMFQFLIQQDLSQFEYQEASYRKDRDI